MLSFGQRAAGLRLERMRASAQWSGEGFVNPGPVPPGLFDDAARPTLGEMFFQKGRRRPPGPLPAAAPHDAWRRPPGSGLRATWLGHSSVLIEIDGVRLLTDPVWGPRASPLPGLGPKRFQPVPVPLRELPPLDAVLISHDHYDHLDWPTIRALALQPVPFITSLGVGAHLQAWGVPAERIVELDWWESYRLPTAEVAIHAAPAQHFSGRSLTDRNATLWSSLVVESARHRVFFSGDTGLTPAYAEVARRLGPFDLVMLEVGAHHPSWGHIHLGPHNALKALRLLGGGAFLPVHWGTFSLALHDWDDPVETLLAHGPAQGARLLLPRLAEPVEPDHDRPLQPWWRAAGEAAPQPGGTGSPDEPVPPLTAAQARAAHGLPWPLD